MSNFQVDFNDPRFSRAVSAGAILLAIIAIVVLFTTTWFTIDPEQRGVVRRLGKYVRTVDPGLHFKLPFGIEKVDAVPVMNQLKVEFGFRTDRPGVRTQYAAQDFPEESLMLTGDLNVADVEWVTQYRISEPQDFLFKVRNVETTFRDMNEAVMREVVGDHSINEVLTTGRMEIETAVRDKLQALCKQYEMGLTVDQVILQDVNPPEPVRPAFNEVNQAQQEKEKLVNQARQQYNQIIPRARGEAAKAIEEAHGYAIERINRARGEAERFRVLFEEYQKAPEVTRQRIYLETMATVMSKVGRKVVVDEESSGILPLLNLAPAQ